MLGRVHLPQVAAAIKDYDVGISIMEEDFKKRPEQMMYSEYPDALVKRGLAKVRPLQGDGATLVRSLPNGRKVCKIGLARCKTTPKPSTPCVRRTVEAM